MSVTLQELIDTIGEDPVQVRSALELIKRNQLTTGTGAQTLPDALDSRTIPVNTVAQLRALPGAKPGFRVSWAGYYSAGDGGGNEGIVEERDGSADDGGSVFHLNDGVHQVRGLFKGGVNVKQFGTLGGGVYQSPSTYQAAIDYCIANEVKLNITDDIYSLNGGIIINGSKFTMHFESKDTRLNFNVGADAESITIAPDNATDPATSAITSINIINGTIFDIASTKTAALVRAKKVTGMTFRNTSLWGGKWALLSEGCRNTTLDNCSGLSVNFSGSSNSAGVKVTSLELTDGSFYEGFTFRVSGGIYGGNNWDSTFLIESNDYTFLGDGVYLGAAKNHILIKPAINDNKIFNTVLSDAYLDGVSLPNTTKGVVIDKTLAPNSELGWLSINGGIIGQLQNAVTISSTTNISGTVRLDNVGIQNCSGVPILSSITSGAGLSVVITGGNCWNYGRGANAGDDIYAISMTNGTSLTIDNWVGQGWSSSISNGVFADTVNEVNINAIFRTIDNTKRFVNSGVPSYRVSFPGIIGLWSSLSGSGDFGLKTTGSAPNYFSSDTRFGTDAEVVSAPGFGNTTTGAGVRSGGDGNFSVASGPSLRANTNADGTVQSFRRSGSQVGSVSVTTTTTSYNTSSDERLKKDIENSLPAGDIIDQLKVRRFNWKINGEPEDFGFVAQELQLTYPKAVSVPDEEDEAWSVDHSKLVPVLVKEIQELRLRVSALEGG